MRFPAGGDEVVSDAYLPGVKSPDLRSDAKPERSGICFAEIDSRVFKASSRRTGVKLKIADCFVGFGVGIQFGSSHGPAKRQDGWPVNYQERYLLSAVLCICTRRKSSDEHDPQDERFHFTKSTLSPDLASTARGRRTLTASPVVHSLGGFYFLKSFRSGTRLLDEDEGWPKTPGCTRSDAKRPAKSAWSEDVRSFPQKNARV